MFDIMLSKDEHGPLYMQLYRHIRSLIQNDEIKDGTKLPSIRSLRQQSSLSKTTIETAYHLLLEEGYVISKPRSGLYVVNPQSTQSLTLRKAAEHENTNLDHRLHRTHDAPHSKNDGVIDFNLLAVDGNSFPLQAWRSVLTESLSLNGGSIHQYGDLQGEYALRLQLTQYLKNSRGVSCSPNQIVIGSSISYSIHILTRLLGQPITVAFEQDGIAQVGDLFSQHGCHIVPFPLHDHQLSITGLEGQNIDAIYVTPSHRPTGNPLSYSIRQQMLQWANNHHTYIIEDDYDGEFRYTGKTIPSLQGLDHKGVVIYMGTFSKAFTPALRMNYMVLPLHLMERLHTMEHILSCPSRIDQLAMSLFIERGHWFRHIRRIRHVYRKKHEKLTQLLQQHFSDHIYIQGDSAGLHIELTVNTNCSATRLIELALFEGVHVYGSQHVGIVPSTSQPRIYMGFGGIDLKDMERGIQQLNKAWSQVLA
ncbi:PLP-dependent aminotransferase family protein [Paenibacillus sp. FA6]|uniref:MocR-like pyridoxine biosynthesis transcription factor PdxR n=1 Tax=Paenibacillus sp. FA6 TaxID=3413029 RepID=UPI003F65AF9C